MSGWAISSPHAECSRIGGEILERGGTAVDAAIASAAALCVALPNNVAIGGDLFALLREPDGTTRALNSSGPAPAAVDADVLRERHGARLPIKGPDTVTVPGLLAGWAALHEAGASAELSRLLRPAIRLAADGIAVDRQVAAALRRSRGLLEPDPGMAATFYPGGEPLEAGALLRQPELAATFERIATEGTAAFYDGDVGAAFVTTLRERGSALEGGDLAAFRPDWTEPVRVRNAAEELVLCPPNSQSFLVGAILAELERGGDPLCDPLSGAGAPRFALAGFRAGWARDRLLADPRFAEVPVHGILDGTADLSEADPRSHDIRDEARTGDGDTIGLVCLDRDGRAVSLVQSVFGSFGSGIRCPRTGIIAHNRGSFFSLERDHPNEIAPGKRPAHTLSPVLIGDERGRLRHVIGTRGGTTQAQILAGVIQRLRLDRSPVAALAAPRLLSGSPDPKADQGAVHLEADAPRVVAEALERAGFRVATMPALQPEAGEVQVIAIASDGSLSAASDPRSDGLALVG